MSTTIKATANGKAATETPTPAAAVNQVNTFLDGKAPTIEQRLKKLAELEQLRDRRETIVDAIENLNGFYIAPTGIGCQIKLLDSNGKSFAISHPSVIGEIVELSKKKLTEELAAIDKQFTFSL